MFSETAEWLADNREWPQWFCYVDSFDVHEPFHIPEPYASMYTDEDPEDPELPFWPFYGPVSGDGEELSERAKQKNPDAHGQSALSERQIEFVRSQYAGNVTFADEWFGQVLDQLDADGLWSDTMVIVTADHGFYLGEHGWMGKPEAPLYDVIAHTPLFVWHPESDLMGDRVPQLTSAVDLYATILDALDIKDADPVHGQSLTPLLHGETTEHRDYALYGYWGSSVNVTDGEYTYLRACDESVESYCHSTTMMNPHAWFTPVRPKEDAESGQFLPYTDTPVWRYSAPSYPRNEEMMLFDSDADPWQQNDLVDEDPDAHERMRRLLGDALADLNAPLVQYDRLGLSSPS
ncbi:sulfatase [Halobium palmae]|uniref:Sulfatase n=1 Tax=Halobium palmae TaxID=1776492 RepID=A0ABD5RX41_9EURY